MTRNLDHFWTLGSPHSLKNPKETPCSQSKTGSKASELKKFHPNLCWIFVVCMPVLLLTAAATITRKALPSLLLWVNANSQSFRYLYFEPMDVAIPLYFIDCIMS
jgi:hypothetical protein